MKTIWLIQKATTVDNWWLTASSQQCACSCITSLAVLLPNIKSPRWLRPLQPKFSALWLLAFPKTKIPFKREEISGHWWDSGKYDRAADGSWENCVRSQGAYFEGDWGVIVLCTMFLVSSSINVSFSYYMAGYLLDRPKELIQLSKTGRRSKQTFFQRHTNGQRVHDAQHH